MTILKMAVVVKGTPDPGANPSGRSMPGVEIVPKFVVMAAIEISAKPETNTDHITRPAEVGRFLK